MAILDRIREPLWDSAKVAAGGRAELFTVPRGQGISVFGGDPQVPKGAADTNMILSCQLPAGYEFVVESLDCEPLLGTPRRLLEAVTLSVRIGVKIYTTLPASRATCRLTDEELAAGWLLPGMRFDHRLANAPLHLAASNSFLVVVESAAHAMVAIRVALNGELRRMIY